MNRFKKRKLINQMILSLSLLAMIFGIFWLIWILWDTIYLGFNGLRIFGASLFTEMTPAPNDQGGLANAIFGSLIMVLLSTLIGTPIGIMAGIYLSEYKPNGLLSNTIRFINDVLLSAPSIIIGLFVYTIMVVQFKSFSALAGIFALSVILIPIVIRTTENMLALVSIQLREAAYALGTPKWKVILSIALRSVKSGVITGILLAIARIMGETAPLLFTSLNNQFWNHDLNKPIASLPVVISKFALSPYENWQQLAWTGIFLITLFILSLNILARFLSRK